MKTRYAFLLSLAFIFSQTAFAASYEVRLYSDPGDFIGGGVNRTLTVENSSLYVVRRNDMGGIDIYIEPNGGTSLWLFSFAGMNDAPLSPDNYENAERYGFQSPVNPGLSATGEHRGCNVIAGRFVVREAVYDAVGEPVSFAIDFEQHCEGHAPALWGFIRYNSQIPFVVPQPNAAAGPDRTYDERATVVLDGSKSSDGDGSIVAYRWTQISGPTAVIVTSTAATTEVILPEVNEGGADLGFQLEVGDNDGRTDTDIVNLHVSDEYDPKSSLYLNAEPDNGIEWPGEHMFTVNQGIFHARRDTGGSVAVSYLESWSYDLYFAAPGNVMLEPGTYTGATRYPFQQPNEPGLSVSGYGRACNQLSGNFTVREIRYGLDRSVESFAADFEQHCEGFTGTLRGTILFNHRKPKPFPVLEVSVIDTPDPVAVRTNLGYSVTVRNNGAVTATNVHAKTVLPDKATFVSASPGCEYAKPVVSCNLANIGGVTQKTVQIVVKPMRKGTNTASTTAEADGLAPTTTVLTSTMVQ